MRFDWDNHKSQLLKQNRGYYLEEVATILAGDYVGVVKNIDKETNRQERQGRKGKKEERDI